MEPPKLLPITSPLFNLPDTETTTSAVDVRVIDALSRACLGGYEAYFEGAEKRSSAYLQTDKRCQNQLLPPYREIIHESNQRLLTMMAEDPTDSSHCLALARNQAMLGNTDLANVTLLALTKRVKNRSEVYVEMAKLKESRKNEEAATILYRLALDEDPTNFEAWIRFAKSLMNRNLLNAEMIKQEENLMQDPKNVKFLLALGFLNFVEGSPNHLVKARNIFLNLAGDSTYRLMALFALGKIFLEMGDIDLSFHYFSLFDDQCQKLGDQGQGTSETLKARTLSYLLILSQKHPHLELSFVPLDRIEQEIEKHPHSSIYLKEKLCLLINQKAYDHVLTLSEVLCYHYPYDLENWFLRADVLAKTGNLHEALEHVNFALMINPNYLKARMKRGEIHLELKNYELAQNDFVFLKSQGKNHPVLNGKLGRCISKLLKTPETVNAALDCLCAELRSDPNRLDLLKRIAKMFFKKRDHENGKVACHELLRVTAGNQENPIRERALLLFGKLCMQAEDYEEADECYSRIMRETQLPNVYRGALAHRIETLICQNKYEEAHRVISGLMEKNTKGVCTDMNLMLLSAHVELMRQNLEGACEALDQAEALGPADSYFYHLRNQLFAALGEPDEVLHGTEMILKRGHKTFFGRFWRGRRALYYGDTDFAINQFSRILLDQALPRNYLDMALIYRAKAFISQGCLEKAEDDLNQVAYQDDWSCLRTRIKLNKIKGDKENLGRVVNRYFQRLRPQFVKVYHHLNSFKQLLKSPAPTARASK